MIIVSEGIGSKATALYLLQSGLVPRKDTGQKTCRYYFKTTDVISILQDRIICPEKYVAAPQWYEDRSRKVAPQKAKYCYVLPMTDELQAQLRQYFEVETAELDAHMLYSSKVGMVKNRFNLQSKLKTQTSFGDIDILWYNTMFFLFPQR